MRISQSNLFKRLSASSLPYAPSARPSVATFNNPVAPSTTGRIPYAPPIGIPVGKGPTNPWTTLAPGGQRMTGRVGGAQTTAFRTQTMSGILGWLGGGSRQQRNLQPLQQMMSWLAPFLASRIAGNARPFGQSIQSWTQSLPQNIPSQALRRRQ